MKDIIDYLENKKVQVQSEIVNMDLKTIIPWKSIIIPNQVTVKPVEWEGTVEGYTLSFMVGGEVVNITQYNTKERFKESIFGMFKQL